MGRHGQGHRRRGGAGADEARASSRTKLAALVRGGRTVWRAQAKSTVACRGLRKWKGKEVKSRLVVRGFRDPQKAMVARYSSTATRLSQRLLCSLAVENNFGLEQWDIGNAFLKGFSFDKMREMCTLFGITVPDVERKVWITVPGNVWFILDKLGFCNVGLNWGWHCLELLKAMYGLVDAPVLWSIALRFFVYT